MEMVKVKILKGQLDRKAEERREKQVEKRRKVDTPLLEIETHLGV